MASLQVILVDAANDKANWFSANKHLLGDVPDMLLGLLVKRACHHCLSQGNVARITNQDTS